ncbi:hypothetical protein BD289DRAFT_423261 [Coniella lustricola]|uniref:Secreted protein n=1 Tax=Coniella lustricola TaxID=2025994 RepID=A0A2T3AJL5_9PEZI|nr:hypothetical protein BD289DRAFT_423261 [Coniella lustricola]
MLRFVLHVCLMPSGLICQAVMTYVDSHTKRQIQAVNIQNRQFDLCSSQMCVRLVSCFSCQSFGHSASSRFYLSGPMKRFAARSG